MGAKLPCPWSNMYYVLQSVTTTSLVALIGLYLDYSGRVLVCIT